MLTTKGPFLEVLLPSCCRNVAAQQPPTRKIAVDVDSQTTGRTARHRPGQEAVMGKAIPTQHPAVVLRSHFNFVRALLGVTMLAVVGLTIAVVIVANDGDEVGSPAAVRPIESIEYGGFNPSTGRPDAAPTPAPEAVSPGSDRSYSGPAPTRKLDGATDLGRTVPVRPGTRYDGGPEEGTRGATTSPPAPGTRYDGGPEEGTRSIAPSTPRLNPQQASPGLSDRAREGKGGPADGIRYDG